MSYAGYSQTDSITVLKSDLVRALKEREDLRAKSILCDTLNVRFQDLQSLVSVKNQIIQNREEMIGVKDETINSLNKALRSQKRRTFFTGLAGVVAIGSVIFLMK